MEKNFRHILRILKFKHRKNIMIDHIDKELDNRLCRQESIGETHLNRDRIFNENFNFEEQLAPENQYASVQCDKS